MSTHPLWQERSRTLLGDDALELLANARVLVVGIGGVGGYTAEMLVRSGIGHITVVDADCVDPSNINRQPVALHSTIGHPKVELACARFADINPECDILGIQQFLTAETAMPLLQESSYDFVADCIDTVSPKVALLEACMDTRTKVISSMGAGGRLDVAQVQYSRLWETREDGLARAVRQAFKKKGLRPMIPCVYSPEKPKSSALMQINSQGKRTSFGTLATVPAVFGIFMANHIIRTLIKQ